MKSSDKAQEFKVKQASQLLAYLISVFPGMGRNSVKQLIRNRCISVNGKVVTRPDLELLEGQLVAVKKSGDGPLANLAGMVVLYEDAQIIVVDKPGGLLTVGTEKEKINTAYSLLSNYVKTQHPKNKVFIVHRLDRDTSGVLVFARDTASRDSLQKAWHASSHVREYVALVTGKIDKPSGRIESWLKENANLQVYSSPVPDDGQHAITHYALLQQNEHHSLLKVTPETGRRNQIRVHLADIGFPIVGDRRYGKGDNPIGRLGLHASFLKFEHPATKKPITFDSKTPKTFLTQSRKP